MGRGFSKILNKNSVIFKKYDEVLQFIFVKIIIIKTYF